MKKPLSVLFPDISKYKIAMVCGEASGDMLASSLITSIKAICPDAQFAGIGGPKMQALGFVSQASQERLAVRGYLEALKRLPELLKIRRDIYTSLIQEKPDIFIGVDAPDFNLALEGKLRIKGIPCVHYVSPSVWAWRAERIKKIAQQVDHVLCLFPMEKSIYEKAGIPATFVGHPLAKEIAFCLDKNNARQDIGIDDNLPVFAVLPGSRVSELDYMVPVFLEAIRLILQALPNAKFLVPLATQATQKRFKQQLHEQKALDLPLHILDGQAQKAMIASDVVLVASGTATLEVALSKRPMIISYKVSSLTYHLVKHKLRLPYVGLPNILLGEKIVPELLQNNATPQNIANELLRVYADKNYQMDLHQRFDELHHKLRINESDLAANVVLELIKKSKNG